MRSGGCNISWSRAKPSEFCLKTIFHYIKAGKRVKSAVHGVHLLYSAQSRCLQVLSSSMTPPARKRSKCSVATRLGCVRLQRSRAMSQCLSTSWGRRTTPGSSSNGNFWTRKEGTLVWTLRGKVRLSSLFREFLFYIVISSSDTESRARVSGLCFLGGPKCITIYKV